jgi:hypothetical protein
VRLTTAPRKKILLRNLKRRPRPTQGCRADDDDDDDKQETWNFEAVDERLCSLRMRGGFNNFTILLVHTRTEENDEILSDSLYDKLNQIHQRIQAHDTKIAVGDFNTKIEREGVLKPFMWNWRLQETSKENGIRAIAFGIDRGWRQGDALSTALFNIVLEKVIRYIEANPNGTIFDRMRQCIAHAECVLMLG